MRGSPSSALATVTLKGDPGRGVPLYVIATEYERAMTVSNVTVQSCSSSGSSASHTDAGGGLVRRRSLVRWLHAAQADRIA